MILPNIIDSLGQEIESIIFSPNSQGWFGASRRLATKIDLITKIMTPSEVCEEFFNVKFITNTQTLYTYGAKSDSNYNRHKLMPDKKEVQWCIFDMLVYGHTAHSDLLNLSTDIAKTISKIAKMQPKDKIGQKAIEESISRIIKILKQSSADKVDKALDMFLLSSINGDIDLELSGYVKTGILEHIYAHANISNYKTKFEAWWENILEKTSAQAIFSNYCEMFCKEDNVNAIKELFKQSVIKKIKHSIENNSNLAIDAQEMGKIIKTKVSFATELLQDPLVRHYLNLYKKQLPVNSQEKKEFNIFMLNGINPAYHNVGEVDMSSVKIESDEFKHVVDSGLLFKAFRYNALNFKLNFEQVKYMLEHKNVNNFFAGENLDLFMAILKETENSHHLAPYVLNLRASEEVAKHYDWVLSSIEKTKLEETLDNTKNGSAPTLKI